MGVRKRIQNYIEKAYCQSGFTVYPDTFKPFVSFNRDAIHSIIVGEKMSPQDLELLKRIAEGLGLGDKLFIYVFR